MKTLVLWTVVLALFSAAGCGDEKRTKTTDRGTVTTDRDVAPVEKDGDNDLPPDPDPAVIVVDPADDPDKDDKDAPDTDLPAGVQEKPADELPKTGAEDKKE